MYSAQEEKANVISHVVGIIIVLITLIISFTTVSTNKTVLPGFYIFMITALGMLTASSLYHCATVQNTKKMLRMLDHISIYALIAGSYTPFILQSMTLTGKGKYLLYVVWGIALVGAFYKLFVINKSKWISSMLYLGMGWMALFFYKDLSTGLDAISIRFLILGALCYTVGVLFYTRRNMKYHHAIWHVLVLAGVLTHLVAIWHMVF